jgi:hypothetical protein
MLGELGIAAMLWRFHFCAANAAEVGGEAVKSEKMAAAAPTLDTAIEEAKSMMKSIVFSFGAADHCLITSVDGTIQVEVKANGPAVFERETPPN